MKQKRSNYGLNPEDESNLEMLLNVVEHNDFELEAIYQSYQEN